MTANGQTGKRANGQTSLEARALDAGYAQAEGLVLRGLDIEVETGEDVALVGPNGSGKSTLLRALGRVLRPKGGVARGLALLPQGPTLSNDLTVAELVWLGRSPHQGLLGLPTAADGEAGRGAMGEAGMGP